MHDTSGLIERNNQSGGEIELGKKIGAVFIIYGILNLIGSIFFLPSYPIIGLAGIVWSIIIIAIGKWMRRRAAAQEHRDAQLDKQTETLEEMRKRFGDPRW